MATFVVFGFGPISAGLFLYEAHASGKFDRLIVAYRRQDIIDAVRANGNTISVNTAHDDRVEEVTIPGVELYNLKLEHDQQILTDALTEASEIATALGSVNDYISTGDGSVHALLARGLSKRSNPCIIYAAENHNHAAEKLEQAILSALSAESHEHVKAQNQFLNTVIGKMSARVTGDAVWAQGLRPIAAGLEQAFLVEAFNRIYVSKPAGFKRNIPQFEEKDDLLPFEEAKLYGHNAVHALAAYLAQLHGLTHIRDLETVNGLLELLHTAFLAESGAALCKKYKGIDKLFSPEGFRHYANDLLTRMMNPYLNDSAARVGRDVQRKLGWDDRLIGTMRLALSQGITPKTFALGVAAALTVNDITPEDLNHLLNVINPEKPTVMALVRAAYSHLSTGKSVQDFI